MKKKIILYSISFVIAIALVLLVCGLRGILTEQKDKATVIIALCDAFFAAGALFLCFGGLSWASEQGAFDGLGYSVSSLFNLRKPAKKGTEWKPKETYEEYVERKHSPDKKKPKLFLIIVGAIFLLVAIIFFIIYKTM